MEKHKRTRKLLAVLLSGALFGAMTLPAMASPFPLEGTGSTENDGSSTGRLKGTLTNGESALSGDIVVQAKTSGGVEIVYNIEVSYGEMRFDYSYGKNWNPTLHAYEGGNTDGWNTDYLVDSNNKITIVNHSNFPVDVGLEYKDDGTSFNADKTANGSVIGVFAESNDDFTTEVLAAGLNGDLGSKVNKGEWPKELSSDPTKRIHLNMNAASIGTGDKYYITSYDNTGSNTLAGNGAESSVCFALSGKPDPGGPNDFVKIGSIKVTVTPASGVTVRTKQ